MNFAETIANLRTELKTKNEAVTALTGERDALAGQVSTLTEQNTGFSTKITELEGSVKTLTEENAGLKTKVEAAEKNVEGQVVERIASAGVPAIAQGGEAASGTQPTAPAGLTGLARVTAAFKAQSKK